MDVCNLFSSAAVSFVQPGGTAVTFDPEAMFLCKYAQVCDIKSFL